MTPKGFWSYVRDDDTHLKKQLTRLRERIAGELHFIYGERFDIFQDKPHIGTSENWEERLKHELNEAIFFIPILTPSYFKSTACQWEASIFLKLREADPVRRIFPIYLQDIYDLRPNSSEKLKKEFAKIQYRDFRNIRPGNRYTRWGKEITGLAKDVISGLDLHPSSSSTHVLTLEASVQPNPVIPSAPYVTPNSKTTKLPVVVALPRGAERSKASVPTHVVHLSPGLGDFTSIQAAIDAADDGAQIEIHPGTYTENLTLKKNLTLVGLDGAKATRIEEGSRLPLIVSAASASLIGLGFHFVTVAEGRGAAALVTAGQATFLDCAFTSDSDVSVRITGQATNPTFRGCSFRDSLQSGASITSGAFGMFEACDFSRNRLDGVQVIEGSNPTLRRCTITSNGGGVQVSGHGRGTFESCEIRDNQRAGVSIFDSGTPILQDSVITRNGSEAIRLEDSTAGGRFIGNDLRGNTRGAWDIAKGAEKNLVREGNKE